MKIEVVYKVVEVTHYRVTKSYTTESPNSSWIGFEQSCGEFETREQAEKVARALDCAAYDEAKRAL